MSIYSSGLPPINVNTGGDTVSVDINSTTTLPAGNNATVTNVGDTTNVLLDFGIPQGITGAKGDNGTAATISIGTVSTVSSASPATITNVGTSANAVFDFEIPAGTKGDKGDPGDDGADLNPPLLFSVLTDATGNATIDLSSFSLVNTPNVQITLIGGQDADDVRVVSKSNTSVVIRATRRGAVTLLAVSVPLFTSSPINGARLDVVVYSND